MQKQINVPPEQVKSFWSKVRQPSPTECWEWQAAKASSGYGHLKISGKDYYSHRVAYELTHGPIADGLHVCHRCDNPPCCNPDHLWLGTHADNMADRGRKGRTARNSTCGEKCPHSKITEADVRTIRSRYADGNVSHRQLAAEYGINQSTIARVIQGKTWAHVRDRGAAS